MHLSATFKTQNKDQDESSNIFNAIHRLKYSELLPDDQRLFLAITADIFPELGIETPIYENLNRTVTEVCDKENLECSDYFLMKIQQMYEMILLYDGIMLVGTAFAGKTTAYQVLSKALQEMSDKY